MAKVIHNEHKQVISLISPRVMTNINMLPLNNNQKDYDDSSNKNHNDNNNDHYQDQDNGSINHPDSTALKKKKSQDSLFKSKHVKKSASFEVKSHNSYIQKESTSSTAGNKNSLSQPHNNNQIDNDNTNSPLMTISSQLMSSKKCVFVYIFLIIISIFSFIYSIIDIFYILNKIPLITCEIILCVVMTSDMIIRIALLGWHIFIRKVLNWIDLLLIVFGLVSIVIYFCLEKQFEIKLEGLSFLIIIILRNAIMLFRIGILYKNEKEITKRRNVEEIIAFDIPNNDDFTDRFQVKGKTTNKQKSNYLHQKPMIKKKGKDGVVYMNIDEEQIKEEDEKRNTQTQGITIPEQL